MAMLNMPPNFMMPPTPYMFNKQQKSYPHTLYLGDLDENIDELILYSFFQKYGNIISLRILRDRNTKKSRGFGFITFSNAKEAEIGKERCNHECILSKPIRVLWNKPKVEQNHDADIHVKNLDPSVTAKDLENMFSPYGTIFSAKVVLNEKIESRGYGYVNFEKKEDAEKCLAEVEKKPIKFHDKEISVSKFIPRDMRDDKRNNLYIKNLPKKDNTSENQAELEKLIKEEFSKFGEISSSVLKFCDNKKGWFAFVCYKNHESAHDAYEKLNGQNPFGTDGPLVISWFEKKETRQLKLKEMSKKDGIINETNIYTKNLKSTVTEDELKKAYQTFGEITSLIILTPKSPAPSDIPAAKLKNTKFAYINFKSKEDAKTALSNAPKNPEIQKLYDPETEKGVYVSIHMRKDQYISFKNLNKQSFTKQQNYQNPMVPPFDNVPMFNRGPMGGMNMNMMPSFMQPMPYPSMYKPPMMMNNMIPPFPMGQMNMGMGPMQNNFNFNRRNNYRGGNDMRRGGMNSRTGGRGGYRPRNQGQQPNQIRQQMPQNPQLQQRPAEEPQVQAQALAGGSSQKLTPKMLKEKLNDFLQLSQEKQRNILGEMLYPLVTKINPQHAPKITGMLIDFSVFEVQDILEYLEDENVLAERVKEAEEMINQSA